MIETSSLPTLNAVLNGTCFLVLLLGWRAIRGQHETLHKACMLLAALLSAVFLTSYLIYHARVGSVKYQGEGTLRVVYFTILIVHTCLAALNAPLVLKTLWHAFKDQRERHRRWARITLPVWMIVSVTGVVVYLMLYRM